ncbi:MAG: hypothetical protein AMJ45_00705 [Syntrophobacter sp. DG_60]|nr:MAG: hypothetical protein AMJ45_00705 [Syntrophobacter sp. DG_60]
MLEVVIIGSGTGVPSLLRACPAILIKIKNSHVLIDSGPGTLRQLLKANVHFSKIDIILYTHLHPDHVADLVHFLFAAKNEPQFRPNKPVLIFGPTGFLDFYEKLKMAYGKWVVLPQEKAVLSEISPYEKISQNDILIHAFPTFHTENSQGYRIETEGKILAYSGDAEETDALISLAKDADIFICEASFPEKTAGHLTPSIAGKIAKKSDCKCLILTHLYPECDAVDPVAQCRRYYYGPLIIAQDLLRIKV